MTAWRTEQWALGSGEARLSCGISRSEDGFAVDLSRGNTCLDSFFYRTRADAERLTRQLKLQYVDRLADA
jgi:hypothetical protein